jgi:hypothetical protein
MKMKQKNMKMGKGHKGFQAKVKEAANTQRVLTRF